MMMDLKFVAIQSTNGGFRAPFFYGVGVLSASGGGAPRREPQEPLRYFCGLRGQLAEPTKYYEKHPGGARGGQAAPLANCQ